MAKDKKKKSKKGKGSGLAAVAAGAAASAGKQMVADVVAAALVATVAALKNPKKAQQLAINAGDELTKLSKKGAKQGSALWDMALQIGRESLDALTSDSPAPAARAKPKARKTAARKPAVKKAAAKKPAAKRVPTRKRTSPARSSTTRRTAKKPK